MFSPIALVAFALIASVNGFYSSNDDVVQLDPSNFDRLVIQSSDVWLIEFYAPWCGRKLLISMIDSHLSAMQRLIRLSKFDT